MKHLENALLAEALEGLKGMKHITGSQGTFEVKVNTAGNVINTAVVEDELVNKVLKVKVAKITHLRNEDKVPDPVPPGYWGDDIVSYYSVYVEF